MKLFSSISRRAVKTGGGLLDGGDGRQATYSLCLLAAPVTKRRQRRRRENLAGGGRRRRAVEQANWAWLADGDGERQAGAAVKAYSRDVKTWRRRHPVKTSGVGGGISKTQTLPRKLSGGVSVQPILNGEKMKKHGGEMKSQKKNIDSMKIHGNGVRLAWCGRRKVLKTQAAAAAQAGGGLLTPSQF